MRSVDDRGAILPIVLLVLLALSLLGTGAFYATGLERRISEAHRASVIALYAAESGLALLMAENPGGLPAYRTYAFPDGDATASATLLVAIDSATSLLLITSRGTRRSGRNGMSVRTLRVVAGRRAGAGGGLLLPRPGSWHERL